MTDNISANDGSALLRAAQWVDALIQGPLVTTLAVLAIAAVGFALLSGRIAMRRVLTVLVGCFLTFGASAIAQGIMGAATNPIAVASPIMTAAVEPPPAPFEIPNKQAPAAAVDPYAGASVMR